VLADPAVTAAAEAALAHGGRPGLALSVVFVDDAEITRLHGDWFDDPTPTDVISFDLGEDEPGPAGELYVSVERARDEARARDLPLERELALYVVHGALNLCGFDDREEGDRRRMRAAEARVLERLAGLVGEVRERRSVDPPTP
jgi:probable rRNA maturation factor